MIKAFKKFLWTVGFLFLGVVLGLGYLGFIPGISNLFGSNTPQDLQAVHTAADLASAQAKLDQEILTGESSPSLRTIQNGGKSDVNIRLSGKEFAAHLEAIHPVKDLQVVFAADGSFEASGRIDKGRILKYAKLLGYADISEVDVLKTVNTYLPGSPSFYLKGRGAITDGVPTMVVDKAKLGRLPASGSGLAKALVEYAKLNLDKVPGLDITTMNITADGVSVIGVVPAVVPKL